MQVALRRSRARTLLVTCIAAFAVLGMHVEVAGAKSKSRKAQAGKKAEAKNLKLLGKHALQARSAYQPLIKFNPLRGRWIAYIGHHAGASRNNLTGEVENNGTSILDVSKPKRPRLLAHIPGKPGDPDAGGAQMAQVCNGRDLPNGDPNKVYLLRAYNGETQELTGHEIWDVTRPRRPELVTTVVSGLVDTHKNWWECNTGIAYLVSGVPTWRAERMTQVFDLSDPANPEHIRDYGLVGQEPGSTGPVPTDLHGPISLNGRVYFGHGTSSDGIMQIADRETLINGDPEPTPENLLAPQISRLDLCAFCGGAHTTFPVLGVSIDEFAPYNLGATRDFVAIVNESTSDECIDEVPQMVYFADITDAARPGIVSNYNVDERKGDFCSRGGRFGAHASNENMTPIWYRKVIFVSWFNAGVRAVDMRNPFRPKGAGYYIPKVTRNTAESCIEVDGQERCKTAIQTNNVEVDDRGLVYIVDRANTGLHILKAKGKLARIARR
jgi:hypothetical protein